MTSPNEAATFLRLAWKELFDPRAPDSYRPRLLDTHGLVHELSQLASLSRQDTRWKKHVGLVQQELKYSARIESCWLSNNPWSANLIARLTKASELPEIADLTTLFASTAPNAVTTTIDYLQQASEGLPKSKRKTLQILKLLGTHALRLQVHPLDAKEAVNAVADQDTISVLDRIKCLFNETDHRFVCILHLTGSRSHAQSIFEGSPFRTALKSDFSTRHRSSVIQEKGHKRLDILFRNRNEISLGRRDGSYPKLSPHIGCLQLLSKPGQHNHPTQCVGRWANKHGGRK